MSALDNARAAIARYDSQQTDVEQYHSMKAAAEALRDLIAEHERLTERPQRPTSEGGVWGSYVGYLAALEAAEAGR